MSWLGSLGSKRNCFYRIQSILMYLSHACIALDESGDAGFSERSSRHIVVAGVTCENFGTLNRVALRARKDLAHVKQGNLPELKASASEPGFTRKLLKRLVKEDVRIFVVIADKHAMTSISSDEVYKFVYSASLKYALGQYIKIDAFIDAFYARKPQQDKFIKTMFDDIRGLKENAGVSFGNSRVSRPLQIADYVAWSLFQYVEHGDDSYRRLLDEKIVAEMTLPRQKKTA